jgi:hypothetical protein
MQTRISPYISYKKAKIQTVSIGILHLTFITLKTKHVLRLR